MKLSGWCAVFSLNVFYYIFYACSIFLGEAEVEALRQKCAAQIRKLGEQFEIEDLNKFIAQHRIDVSFATDDTSSFGKLESSCVTVNNANTTTC